MQNKPVFGVIGGSGLYQMKGLQDPQELSIQTPFGPPSAPLVVGRLQGQLMAFLARHGRGHTISPSEINYRANIYALKLLGVEQVIAISACGSLREDYAPGDIVIPDQLYDHTHRRERSFFEGGLVAHVGVAEPFCSRLSERLAQAAEQTGAHTHRGGAFITIEGPRFSTRAESNTYRAWGMSLIGMTTSPEAFLAREAEMCYAVMAHVTDYDVWRISSEPVSVEAVIAVMAQNTAHAQEALHYLASAAPAAPDCECDRALATALITQPDQVSAEARRRLGLLVEKYLS